MLRVENLSKHFDRIKAVDNISFEVKRSEILGFLGPNGAGKTTTMKMITGYLAPTSGKIFIEDRDVLEDPIWAKKKIGYVPENFPLYDDMIVYEYLDFICEIREIPSSKREDKIREVGSLCGLEKVIGRPISELSKGYRQRVGLAQALIHEPEILILDEPTDGLDPNQKIEIRHLIREIGKTRTVLLSTHNLPEVQLVCNRVVIINEGKIVAEGTPDELEQKSTGNNVLHLEFDKDYDGVEEKIRVIDGVLDVKRVSGGDDSAGVFEVEYKKDAEIRPYVFRLASEQGWILMEMYREQASLEEIFQRLTQS